LSNLLDNLLQTSLPSTGDSEKLAIARVLDSGYLGMGPAVAAFEQELADYLGNDVSVACVNSGTAALHLACEAVGLAAGDEVLVPSLTFVASFQAVAASGARPVPCDVKLQDGLLDVDDAVRRLTKNTRAIMPVYYAGYPGDLSELYSFAGQYNLRVIEDAAHAFGSSSDNALIGSKSDISCFSFDPIKNITSGEGGAVVSRDRSIIRSVREMRNLGIKKTGDEQFEVTGKGWRLHMPDLMAAIGRVQLAKFENELKPSRQSLHRKYRQYLENIEGINLLQTSDEVVPHIQPVRLPVKKRKLVRGALHDAGFETRIHYKPNHLHECFRDGYDCPVSEQLFRELLTLPTHPGVTEQHVEQIASIIASSIASL